MRSFKLHLFFSITLNLLLKNNFMELPAQRKSGSRDFSFIRQIQLEVSLGNLNLASYIKVFNCIVYKFRLLLPLVCLFIYLFIFLFFYFRKALRKVDLHTSFSRKVSFVRHLEESVHVRMSDHLTYIRTCLHGYQLDTHSEKRSLLQDRTHHCDRDSVCKHGLMK